VTCVVIHWRYVPWPCIGPIPTYSPLLLAEAHTNAASGVLSLFFSTANKSPNSEKLGVPSNGFLPVNLELPPAISRFASVESLRNGRCIGASQKTPAFSLVHRVFPFYRFLHLILPEPPFLLVCLVASWERLTAFCAVKARGLKAAFTFP